MAKPKTARPSAGERQARTLLGVSEARVARLEAAVVAIGQRALLAEQKLANREGYIERVWDVEQAKVDVAPTDEPGAVADLRRLIAGGPDRLASSLIEVIPPELMERVLGKPDEGGF